MADLARVLLDGAPHTRHEVYSKAVRGVRPEYFMRLKEKAVKPTLEARKNWQFTKLENNMMRGGHLERLDFQGNVITSSVKGLGHIYQIRLTSAGREHWAAKVAKVAKAKTKPVKRTRERMILTPEQIADARRECKPGSKEFGYVALARKYGRSPWFFRRLMGYERPRYAPSKLTLEDIRDIKRTCVKNSKDYGITAMARKFNVHTCTISYYLRQETPQLLPENALVAADEFWPGRASAETSRTENPLSEPSGRPGHPSNEKHQTASDRGAPRHSVS
jgi:hypothetical protein